MERLHATPMLGSMEAASALADGHHMRRTLMEILAGSRRWAMTREGRWTFGGIAVGVLAGLMVGGMGLALLGGAIALKGWAVFGAISGLIGNRLGLMRWGRVLSPRNQKA